MVLRRWEPFRDLRTMEDTINRMWRGFGGQEGQEVEGWSVPLDVVREGDNILIHASLPGVDPGNIDVSVEDNVLTIRAATHADVEHKEGEYLMRERRSGSFHRALRLPDTVDTEKIHPGYKNGVLTISIPKAEAKKAKQLKVVAE